MRFRFVTSMLLFSASQLISAQDHQYHMPVIWDVNIGGMVPTGETSASNNATILLGGGGHVPIGKWLQWDGSLDFGFGNSPSGRTVTFSDGSARKTSDYQMIAATGATVNLPLNHQGLYLGMGGGYAGVIQNEFVPSNFGSSGGVTTITDYNCTSCFHRIFSGPYGLVGLYKRGAGGDFGISARYITSATKDYVSVAPSQNWLTFSLTFGFRL